MLIMVQELILNSGLKTMQLKNCFLIVFLVFIIIFL